MCRCVTGLLLLCAPCNEMTVICRYTFSAQNTFVCDYYIQYNFTVSKIYAEMVLG